MLTFAPPTSDSFPLCLACACSKTPRRSKASDIVEDDVPCGAIKPKAEQRLHSHGLRLSTLGCAKSRHKARSVQKQSLLAMFTKPSLPRGAVV